MRLAKYNTATNFFTILLNYGTRSAKANPTLAAGDVTISKDGGAYANLATLPDVQPASGTQVRIQLSATELQCKVATIRFADQTSPPEWDEQYAQIHTYGNASAHIIFDLGTATVALTDGTLTDASFAAATYPKALRTATAQASAAGYITLDASASATNDLYVGNSVKIVSGTGAGQSRTIIYYDGSNKRAYVDRVWTTTPSTDSVFVINVGKLTIDVLNVGIAAAGASSTITLASGASSVNDYYDGALISIVSGTGVGQSRVITGYVGSTRVATVADAWATSPDNTSVYVVRGLGDIEVGVNNDKTGYSLAADQAVNVTKVNGDATSASNLASQFNGTGLTGNSYPARQDQLSSLVAVGAAVNKVMASWTNLSTPVATTETGGVANTQSRDATYDVLTNASQAQDSYYETNIGSTGVPVSVSIYAAVQSGTKSITYYGYDWVAASWKVLGTQAGTAGLTFVQNSFPLTDSMVGTGANLGKVRIRIFATAGTPANTTVTVDQMYVSYSIVNQSVGYSQGSIWVDSTFGSAGTTPFVNGTGDHPVSTWADALAIATALGFWRFNIAPGTTITSTGNCKKYAIGGRGYLFALGGYDYSYATISDCETITGVATCTDFEMFIWRCQLGACTLGEADLHECHITDVITLGDTKPYLFANCVGVPIGTSGIDFGSAVGASSVVLGNCSGKWTIANMKTGDVLIATGNMELELAASCTGGTVYIDGCVALTNNGSGQTIVDTSRYSVNKIWDEVLTGATHNVASSAGRRLRQIASQTIWEGVARGAGTNGNQIQLDTGASSVNGAYDPSLIAIVAGTGAGQSRLIYQYEGSTRMATVDRDWKVQPSTDSEFIIYAHPGREHVNEGLAQAGGTSTITLNANASSLDGNYIGQLVFIRSGTGQDQIGLVTAYNGTTKVATVAEPWGIVPDTTSAYVMLPTHVHEPIEIATSVWDKLVSGLTTVGSIGKKLADWVLGTDNKIILSTDSQSGVTIPTVTSITNRVTANTDQISGSASAATKLALSANTIQSGTVDNTAFTPTTTELEASDITDAETNLYKDRWIIFTSGTLIREAKPITAYSLVSGRGHFTYQALSSAPANGVTFIIV